MILYKCDMCGEVHKDLGEMTDVTLSHAGTSTVNYPRDGKFQVCKECTNRLLVLLLRYNEAKEAKAHYADLPEGQSNGCGDGGGNRSDLYKEALHDVYQYLHRNSL